MQVQVEASRTLLFDDGAPVRSASALARLGAGWLVAQDDATHGAWVLRGSVRRLELLPGGPDSPGPDLQAACSLVGEGGTGVLLLGSGATPARRRGVLVTEHEGEPEPRVEPADLGGLYEAAARALGLRPEQLDVEGVARNGPVLRVFSRGDAASGVPDASVDVGLPALLDALRGRLDPSDVPLRAPRRYDLGRVGGRALAATDAVALPGGRLLLSAATGDAQATALVLLDGDHVLDLVELPRVEGVVQRVEGLGVLELLDDGVRVLAVVDAEDPAAPSTELALRVAWD